MAFFQGTLNPARAPFLAGRSRLPTDERGPRRFKALDRVTIVRAKHRRMPVFARSPVTGWLACAYGVRCGSVPVKTASDQKDCANRNWCPDRRGNEAEALDLHDPVCQAR